MDAFLEASALLLPLGYLLAVIAYGLLFFAEHPLANRAATPLLVGTVVLHVAHLTGVTLRYGQFPAVTVPQALSVVALAVAVVYLFVEWHGRERSTGFWLVSMVFFFQLLASLLPALQGASEVPDREIFHSVLFASHVSLALLGYAAFVVSAGYAFLFLELYRELKAGQFSTFFGKLPPLEVLERMMTGALLIGFVTLTGAVALGIVWAQKQFPGEWLGDPKILFTFAVWALYGSALVLRKLRHWHGRQTAMASLTGLGAILFSLLAVNFLFSGFHGFNL